MLSFKVAAARISGPISSSRTLLRDFGTLWISLYANLRFFRMSQQVWAPVRMQHNVLCLAMAHRCLEVFRAVRIDKVCKRMPE
jgi:hypothetical protein